AAGLNLWLKADKDVSFSSGNISSRANQGLLSSIPSVVPNSTTITRDNTGFNYNPVMRWTTATADIYFGPSSNSFANNALPVSAGAGSIFGTGTISDQQTVMPATSTTSPCGADRCCSGFRPSYAQLYGYNIYYPASAYFPAQNTTRPNIYSIQGTAGSGTAYAAANGSRATVAGTTISSLSSGFTYQVRIGSFMGYSYGLNHKLSESIAYNRQLSLAETRRVESYLAIKNAVTLDPSGLDATAGYVSSQSVSVFSQGVTGTTYWNNIIGLARDSAFLYGSGLYQKQSKLLSDSVRIYTSTLQTTNAANTSSYTDQTFLMLGSNSGPLCGTATTESELPAVLLPPNTPGSRIDREFKIQNTGFTMAFTIELVMNCSVGDDDNLRLLVDRNSGGSYDNADGDFTNATVVSPGSNGFAGYSYNRTGRILTLQLDPLATASLFAPNTTRLFTVAATTFPVLATGVPLIKATWSGNAVIITWQAAGLRSGAQFVVQRSADGATWRPVASLPASPVSSLRTYSAADSHPLPGINLYRLRVEDSQGGISYSNVVSMNSPLLPSLPFLRPNPFTNQVEVAWPGPAPAFCRMIDPLGRPVTLTVEKRGGYLFLTAGEGMPGLYILEIRGAGGIRNAFKLIRL
ncbi:hypothetical protein, partial [Foetidibacter luteolus]|uniref:hypothetical protein n=1 Tax=Foetidibacter luteolus TaxID=2608880 RepID=UPI001A9832D1